MPARKSVRAVAALTLFFILLLVACAQLPAAVGTVVPSKSTPTPAAPSGKTQVEVFSWWTGGGEAAGLDAMIKVFKSENPEIGFINAAIAGGAGTNARAVLATRLQANNPPDSWQAHAGQEIIGTYVAARQIEALNFIYEQEGWLKVMPQTLIPLISENSQIYSVPVNIHRANVMWYNPALLKVYGIEPDALTDLSGWIKAMDTLKYAGVQPLAMGEQWTAMHLMETVLLASLGFEGYNGLWDGTTRWDSPEVRQSLENFRTILGYTNSDAANLTWQDAAQLVVNGDAAFNVMGDWAEGYFKELKKAPGTGFGWIPVPGTRGSFQFLSDSFTLAANAPHRDAALAWLKICGSRKGQDAFNPLKGSIPARKDADRAFYDAYLQSAMDDWANDTITGSLTHGVVANDAWKKIINDALGVFLTDLNVEKLQAALTGACIESGPCKP